jgi:hypothetical protein
VLRGFVLDPECQRVGWQDQPPDAIAILATLKACRECVVAVDTLVLEETERWVEAFSAAIEDIDKSAPTTPAPEPRRAALNLTPSNGDTVSSTWELVLDGGAPERRIGRTMAPRSCARCPPRARPGPHRRRRAARRSRVDRRPGGVVELELTLA